MSEQTVETAWRTYEIINEWIKFSDAKAGAILAADGVIASVVFALLQSSFQVSSANLLTIIIIVLGIICVCFSVYFSLLCLNPTLKVGEPKSLIFFDHIAQKYQIPADYKKDFLETFNDTDTAITQITEQIWANSKVAKKKYFAVTWSTRFFGAIVVIILIGTIVSWF